MADKITKADLFDDGADLNSRGYKKNANVDGEPDQTLMENWNESIAWKTEDGDRATQSTGAEPVEDLKGLVQIATDTEAKANTTGLEATTTKVPHTGQLPTVTNTDGNLDVAATGEATRNEFSVDASAQLSSKLIPAGGGLDEVLLKNSATDYDVSWGTAPSATSAEWQDVGVGLLNNLFTITYLGEIDEDKVTGGTLDAANTFDFTDSAQSYLKYLIEGDIMHLHYNFRAKITSSPAISAFRTGVQLTIDFSSILNTITVGSTAGSCIYIVNNNLSTLKTKPMYVLSGSQSVYFSPTLVMNIGQTESNFKQIAGQIFLKLNR